MMGGFQNEDSDQELEEEIAAKAEWLHIYELIKFE